MCWYHVIFELDFDLEPTLDAGLPGNHRVQVWWRSGHLMVEKAICAKKFTDRRTDGRTDGRRTPRHCVS